MCSSHVCKCSRQNKSKIFWNMNCWQPRLRTKHYFLPPQKNGRNIAPEQFPKLGGMGEGWKSRRGSRIGRGRREEGRVGGRWARTEFQSAAMVRCRGTPGETHCSRYNRVWNQVLLTKRSGNQVLQYKRVWHRSSAYATLWQPNSAYKTV